MATVMKYYRADLEDAVLHSDADGVKDAHTEYTVFRAFAEFLEVLAEEGTR